MRRASCSLTKKQRTSVLCVILTLLLVASATGCSFAELTRQKADETTLPEKPEKGILETAPAPEQAQKAGFLRDAALRTKFTPDAAQVPDDEIVGFFRAAEGALADVAFTVCPFLCHVCASFVLVSQTTTTEKAQSLLIFLEDRNIFQLVPYVSEIPILCLLRRSF